MATSPPSLVVGVFRDSYDANRAVHELHQAGFTDRQIGVVMKHANDAETVDYVEGVSHTESGALAGALTGLGLGALAGLGVLAGIVPVVGHAVAAGTLGVILSNAAAGATVSGLIGALIGAGIPEHEAGFYQAEFEAGRVIVTVQADQDADEATAILRRCGGYDIGNPARDPLPE